MPASTSSPATDGGSPARNDDGDRSVEPINTSPPIHNSADVSSDSVHTSPPSPRHRYSRAAAAAYGGTPNSILLREHQVAFDQLKTDSFNQALRINYLEERLLAYKQGTAFETEDLENEVFQMRVTLQERESELKQKTQTIQRATAYMKDLQAQIHAAHIEIVRLRTVHASSPPPLQQSPSPRRTLETADDAAAATTATQLRNDLQQALERIAHQRTRMIELEDELTQHQDAVATMTATQHDLQETSAANDKTATHLRETLATTDAALASARADVTQWRALAAKRDDDAMRLRDQLDVLTRDHAQQLRQSDAHAQAHAQQLQAQLETLRTDAQQLRNDRERARFERERAVLDADVATQARERAQVEIERLAHALEQATSDAEAFRLQTVKLTATLEHKTQSIERSTSERERNDATTENELQQWRNACVERDATIEALGRQVEAADDAVKRLQTKLEAAVATQQQQTTHERLQTLETERTTLESECLQLRQDVAARQQAIEQRTKQCDVVRAELEAATALVRTLKDQLADSEAALQHKTAALEASDQRMVDATAQSDAALQQQIAAATRRFAAEKNELLQALHDEQSHADALQQRLVEVEAAHVTVSNELNHVANELRVAVAQTNQTDATSDANAWQALRTEFASASAAIETKWQHQTATLMAQVASLERHVCASEGKLQVLEHTTLLRVQDTKQTTERSWSLRFEALRLKTDAVRRTLETDVREAHAAAKRSEDAAKRAETALARATSEIATLTRTSATAQRARSDVEQTLKDVQASNKVLVDEVRACRKAVDHSRKQHVRAVAENKDLLAAMDVYKNALADRERELAKHEATTTTQTQTQTQRVNFSDVKQTLLEQLEQTQFMIHATYKRWCESDAGGREDTNDEDAADAAMHAHWDESIGRLESVTDRWHEFVRQSRELQRRYGDALRSSSTTGTTTTANRPTWVDDVERKSRRLLTESVRVSEALRDVVENILSVVQRERNERKAFRREQKIAAAAAAAGGRSDRVRKPPSFEPAAAAARRRSEKTNWLNVHSEYEQDDDDDSRSNQQSPRHGGNSRSNSESVEAGKKRVAAGASGASSRTRGGGAAAEVYDHSIVSLGRLDAELQEIERKVRAHVD